MLGEKRVGINYQFLPSPTQTKLINDEVKYRLSKSFEYLSGLVVNVVGKAYFQTSN
jgi:hypothetical protein